MHYWLSNLPKRMPSEAMADILMGRWRTERDNEELKGELGLEHYEGRYWRGFHHHASLCIAAYGFLTLERLAGIKKNAARFETPALPEGFRPRVAVVLMAIPGEICKLLRRSLARQSPRPDAPHSSFPVDSAGGGILEH